MQEITDWIQQLEYQDLEFVEFGSEILEPEVIEDLEKAMANHQKKSKIRIRQMKPSMLFKVIQLSSLVFRLIQQDH